MLLLRSLDSNYSFRVLTFASSQNLKRAPELVIALPVLPVPFIGNHNTN